MQIRVATKVHDFHCDSQSVPKNADPVYALAVQEKIELPELRREEYLCKESPVNIPSEGIQTFTYVAPVEATTDQFIRYAIIRNVQEQLSELLEQDRASGNQRFNRMSMIELAPPDSTLSENDTAVLVVSYVASHYEYLADVPTAIIVKIGDNAVTTSSLLSTGRIVVQSDKILF